MMTGPDGCTERSHADICQDTCHESASVGLKLDLGYIAPCRRHRVNQPPIWENTP